MYNIVTHRSPKKRGENSREKPGRENRFAEVGRGKRGHSLVEEQKPHLPPLVYTPSH